MYTLSGIQITHVLFKRLQVDLQYFCWVLYVGRYIIKYTCILNYVYMQDNYVYMYN